MIGSSFIQMGLTLITRPRLTFNLLSKPGLAFRNVENYYSKSGDPGKILDLKTS